MQDRNRLQLAASGQHLAAEVCGVEVSPSVRIRPGTAHDIILGHIKGSGFRANHRQEILHGAPLSRHHLSPARALTNTQRNLHTGGTLRKHVRKSEVVSPQFEQWCTPWRRDSAPDSEGTTQRSHPTARSLQQALIDERLWSTIRINHARSLQRSRTRRVLRQHEQHPLRCAEPLWRIRTNTTGSTLFAQSYEQASSDGVIADVHLSVHVPAACEMERSGTAQGGGEEGGAAAGSIDREMRNLFANVAGEGHRLGNGRRA